MIKIKNVLINECKINFIENTLVNGKPAIFITLGQYDKIIKFDNEQDRDLAFNKINYIK